MRSLYPCGGALTTGGVAATLTLTEVPGTVAVIDVPKGHVAIVTTTGYLTGSSSTIRGGVMVDGNMAEDFSSAVAPGTGTGFTVIAQVGSGRHRIAAGLQVISGPAAGSLNYPRISWVIVRKDLPL